MSNTKKPRKLTKSQSGLLANRSGDLGKTRLSIMNEIERRDQEIINRLLNDFCIELGIDVENEDWKFDEKSMSFLHTPEPDPPKK